MGAWGRQAVTFQTVLIGLCPIPPVACFLIQINVLIGGSCLGAHVPPMCGKLWEEVTAMFSIDQRQVKQLSDALGELNARGIPYAQRNAINDMAFATQADARQTIGREFVNRNKWTQRSVQVERARFPDSVAIVGSRESYMADQEFGATGGPRHVPTPAASGESPRATTRRRVVRKGNRMNAIKLGARGTRTGSRKQQNIANLKQAKARGDKFVYLDRGRTKGIYKVMGTKRKPKARKVQDLTRPRRVVTKHPWLLPATDRQAEKGAQFYARRLGQQLRRLRR